MKNIFSFRSVWIVILLEVLLSACNQKQLFVSLEETGIVDVIFDWRKAPDADPDGFTLIFFPTDDPDKEIWRFDVAGREGGNIELPYGSYDVLAVNNNLPNIDFINQTSFSLFGAIAIEDGSSLPDGTTVLLPTGMLYGTVLHNINHTEKGISIAGKPVNFLHPQDLILTPDSLTTQYNLRMGPISIPPTLKKLSVWISGTGDSMTISDGVVQGDTAVPFENLSFRDDIVTGSTTAFGGRNDDFQKYGLTFRFQDDYGRTFYKNIDITEIVVNSEWSHNVYIDIGDIDFSDTIGGNTDFGNPIGVDGWENIDTDYVIYFP